MSLPPIHVVDLFAPVSERTIGLLRSLSFDEWNLPTVSSRRRVRDVAAHLLDGSLRRLSLQRDGAVAPDGATAPRAGETLLAFLDRMNVEWEVAARRLSPAVIVDLLERADRDLATFFASLDPFGEAIFSVAWAGEDRSANWMDVAREYTEKWHHTQQIFDATARPSTIVERRLYHPCLDIFMRALPFALRDVARSAGTAATVRIEGEAGGDWHVVRTNDRWEQAEALARPSNCVVTLTQASAWKVFTKRQGGEAKLARHPDIRIVGDRSLGLAIVETVSVMA